MARSNNTFRGGNVVHRIELPRRRRANRPSGGPIGPPGQRTWSPGPPEPTEPPPPPRENPPEPTLRGPGDERDAPVVDVEFEVLDGFHATPDQLVRAQERQVELEFALKREASVRENLRIAHREEIEFLERRLTKLRGLLDAQEVDLRRAVAEGQIDSGWASCYREVQGLDMNAHGAELKREMLDQIFQANRELQTRIASLGA